MNIRYRIGFPQVSYAPDGPAGGGSAGSPSGNGSAGGSTSPASSQPSGAASATGGEASASSAAPPAVSPQPSGTPSPASPPATEATTVGDDFFDFTGLGGSDADDDDPPAPATTKPTAQQKAPAQAGAQAPADGQQPKSPEGQQTAPDGQQQQPASQQQVPSPQGQQGDSASFPTPAEPQRIAEALQANADALIAHMAENDFKLSKEDIEALETDAPAHIPKLLARTMFKMQVNVYNQMAKVIPAMVQRMQDVSKASSKGEAKFYAAWPDLKPDQHGDIVKRFASVYRKANPQATLDQLVAEVGPMVMMAAKVSPSQQQASGGGNSPQPKAPVAVGRPPSPFKPAVGGSAASPQQVGTPDPWSGLAAPVDDDEG